MLLQLNSTVTTQLTLFHVKGVVHFGITRNTDLDHQIALAMSPYYGPGRSHQPIELAVAPNYSSYNEIILE